MACLMVSYLQCHGQRDSYLQSSDGCFLRRSVSPVCAGAVGLVSVKECEKIVN